MQITVNGQHIAIVDDTLVSNSVNIYECEFEFDASWDGFAKTSVWQLNSDDPIEVVIDSGVAVIPHEVLENAGILRIGVYGTKDEKVMPTVWLEKRKVCLGTPTGSIGTEPTPSIYAQILAVATEAKDIAEDVQTEWESVSATAETLPSDASATASFDGEVFSFGIPQGEQGTDGADGFSPIVTVAPITNGHRVTITDAEGVHTFDVLDGTDGQRGADGVGITNIVMNADYTLTITLSNGTSYTTPSIRGEQGEQGEDGNGIASITKTATVGKVDTYTITYTDGTTTTFDVTNGEVTEASLEEALIDKADVILNTASGTIATFDDGANMPVKSLEVEINAVQSGSGDPSPTNIRPISGWDAVNVVRTGKNLFDKNAITDNAYLSTTTGEIEYSSTYRVSDYITVKKGETVYIPNTNSTRRWFYDINKNPKTYLNTAPPVIFTPSEDGFIRVTISKVSGQVIDLDTLQIELGNAPSTYEEYQGTTYPITLPSTCYGGKIKDGVLTVTHAIVDLGTLTWSKSSSGAGRFYATVPTPSYSFEQTITMLCSNYKYDGNGTSTGYYGANGTIRRFWTSGISTAREIYICDESKDSLTASEFKSAMNGVQLVYPLETPIEITLSDYPTVETVKGVNNLWSDSGDVAVIYRADTKKYIDGTIVDVPLAMIAPIETGTKSSRAYAVGEYFILGGTQFCKAKTSIASGATFTLNTNYTVTTIATELKALQ